MARHRLVSQSVSFQFPNKAFNLDDEGFSFRIVSGLLRLLLLVMHEPVAACFGLGFESLLRAPPPSLA